MYISLVDLSFRCLLSVLSVLREGGGEAVGLQDAQDLVARHSLDLGDAEATTATTTNNNNTCNSDTNTNNTNNTNNN